MRQGPSSSPIKYGKSDPKHRKRGVVIEMKKEKRERVHQSPVLFLLGTSLELAAGDLGVLLLGAHVYGDLVLGGSGDGLLQAL